MDLWASTWDAVVSDVDDEEQMVKSSLGEFEMVEEMVAGMSP